MAPLPTLSATFETITRKIVLKVSSSSSHSPTPDDIEARTTIIFGTFGTLIATVGILLAGVTLRLMYRAHLAKSHSGSDVVVEEGIEFHTTDAQVPPEETVTVDDR